METIFEKPLDKQVAENTDHISNLEASLTLSLNDVFSSIGSNIVGSAAVNNNVMTLYLQGLGIANLANEGTIGILKNKYRPNLNSGNYVITPIRSQTPPYAEQSTAWFYKDTGEVKKYGSNGFYISTSFVIVG